MHSELFRPNCPAWDSEVGHFILVNKRVNPRVPLSRAVRGDFYNLWKKSSVGNTRVSGNCIRPTVENLDKFWSFLTIFCPKSVPILSRLSQCPRKKMGEPSGRKRDRGGAGHDGGEGAAEFISNIR